MEVGFQPPVRKMPGSKITGIAGEQGHSCGKPSACMGKRHEVTIDGDCSNPRKDIQLIIVRHGTKPSHAVLKQRLPVSVQHSPFELPPP
jgi:hypothetical protein